MAFAWALLWPFAGLLALFLVPIGGLAIWLGTDLACKVGLFPAGWAERIGGFLASAGFEYLIYVGASIPIAVVLWPLAGFATAFLVHRRTGRSWRLVVFASIAATLLLQSGTTWLGFRLGYFVIEL